MTKEETRVLRRRWTVTRGTMVPEWAESFEAFRAWATEKGWVPGVHIVAMPGKRIGPDTVRLVETNRLLEESAYNPTPGFSHRPCLECWRIEERCTTPCDKYMAHLNATMERAREIAYRGKKWKKAKKPPLR